MAVAIIDEVARGTRRYAGQPLNDEVGLTTAFDF
jgi:hypothetical protein